MIVSALLTFAVSQALCADITVKVEPVVGTDERSRIVREFCSKPEQAMEVVAADGTKELARSSICSAGQANVQLVEDSSGRRYAVLEYANTHGPSFGGYELQVYRIDQELIEIAVFRLPKEAGSRKATVSAGSSGFRFAIPGHAPASRGQKAWIDPPVVTAARKNNEELPRVVLEHPDWSNSPCRSFATDLTTIVLDIPGRQALRFNLCIPMVGMRRMLIAVRMGRSMFRLNTRRHTPAHRRVIA